MDARLDPHDFIGIRRGDAHVIRNAGGRASEDAIRSLVVSHKLLGTTEWYVIHHTDCGMEMVTTESMGQLLSESLSTATYNHSSKKFENTKLGGGSYAGKFTNWLTISDQHQSIKEDVHRIITHPLVNADEIVVHGYLYVVTTGKMEYVCSGGNGTNTAVAHADKAALVKPDGPEIDPVVRAAGSTFYVPPTPREHQRQGAQDQAKVAVFEEANRLARAAREGKTSCGNAGCGCADKNKSEQEQKRSSSQLA
jgi:carbonic anhydrase